MPSASPAIGDVLETRLQALGATVRACRKRQKLSAAVAAEAAGVSRVTLHRIERGEPSVTMGAYLSAISAVGLELGLNDPLVVKAERAVPTVGLPDRVRLDDYPQLKSLAWQMHGVAEIDPAQALSLYERNWRHVDPDSLSLKERALVQALAEKLGGGRLLV